MENITTYSLDVRKMLDTIKDHIVRTNMSYATENCFTLEYINEYFEKIH